jgi:hypothetical protein
MTASESSFSSLLSSSATPSTLPVNFYTVMDQQYPEANSPLPASRKRKSKGPVSYVCRLCPSWRHGHKATAANHVQSVHGTSFLSPPINQRSISAMFASVASPDALRQAFNRQAYNEAIVGLLTRRRVPFSAVEWEELRNLAIACNPAINDQLITSRRSAMNYIVANYGLYMDQIKDGLATASSPIHLSSDLWTSPHRHAMLAVCAQWVDKDYQLQKALLGLPECRDTHSGERQANLIIDTLEKFGISSNLGYHTGDNATSNDTCLEHIARRLADEFNVSLKFILLI